MALIPVCFVYLTGLRQNLFSNVRLTGSWDAQGRHSDTWTTWPMEAVDAEDGCPAFEATAMVDDQQDVGLLRWGVILNGPGGQDLWGIPTEVGDHASRQQHRVVDPSRLREEQRYYLTHCRRLGANKHFTGSSSQPAIRFSVWAPNATAVELVFGDAASGYIANDGTGMVPPGPFTMSRDADGVWTTTAAPELERFADLDHRPYMFRITNEQGRVVYRTDIYSRCQIGRGKLDPAHLPPGQTFSNLPEDLDGTVSCSVVVDPEQVSEDVSPETQWLPESDFWAKEFDPARPVPTRVEDLVIYELHVGGLGFGADRAGTLADAIEHLDYLVDLGVNAVQLLPMAEFEGWASWGYGTSHHLAVEYSGGGRDQFKQFVRKAHRRGLAVILDVVYNHYIHDAERAQWAYDSDTPENNIYYWYEPGSPGCDHQEHPPDHGGYIDNWSTGYAPRLWEEMVRKLFISSAVALVTEFHIDGFRVDQTTSLHAYAVLHGDQQRAADHARIFGAKFLREWSRTLKLIKPDVMLMAEDHSTWAAVTDPAHEDFLGFDATWYADFYHHLIGDGERDSQYARLIAMAGFDDNRPLAMDLFAGALATSGYRKVVYHESHDEAGNARLSGRTMAVAVNREGLEGQNRRVAEARCRVAFSLAMLSAGTPMFFMGEEIGAYRDYPHDKFEANREDFATARLNSGSRLFKFYRDLIQFRLTRPALRSRQLEIVHIHNDNRVLAFLRRDAFEEYLVVTTLANHPWSDGYVIQHPGLDGTWLEVFNSGMAPYGGDGVGNGQTEILAQNGFLSIVLPSNSTIVLARR